MASRAGRLAGWRSPGGRLDGPPSQRRSGISGGWGNIGHSVQIRFHNPHGPDHQAVFERGNDELGFSWIFLNEIRHGLKLRGRGAQLPTVAELSLVLHDSPSGVCRLWNFLI